MKSMQFNTRLEQRRQFIQTTASAAGLVLAGCAAAAASGGNSTESPKDDGREEAEVTPGEDLMQEHGILERILLVYDEASRRIVQSASVDLTVITGAAAIIRRFVEDYHEKLEEQFVFPRLQAAGREVDLVAVLLRQHERGRQLTDDIVREAQAGEKSRLEQSLRSFVRMYRPHASREETVLFPAFRGVVGRAGYRELGEEFEDREHQLFGEDGFDQVVRQVADLERALEIYDLASFTPA
jgi:hemerythrin-like domain-containing protein